MNGNDDNGVPKGPPPVSIHSLITTAPILLKSFPLPPPVTEPPLDLSTASLASTGNVSSGAAAGRTSSGDASTLESPTSAAAGQGGNYSIDEITDAEMYDMLRNAAAASKTSGSYHTKLNPRGLVGTTKAQPKSKSSAAADTGVSSSNDVDRVPETRSSKKAKAANKEKAAAAAAAAAAPVGRAAHVQTTVVAQLAKFNLAERSSLTDNIKDRVGRRTGSSALAAAGGGPLAATAGLAAANDEGVDTAEELKNAKIKVSTTSGVVTTATATPAATGGASKKQRVEGGSKEKGGKAVVTSRGGQETNEAAAAATAAAADADAAAEKEKVSAKASEEAALNQLIQLEARATQTASDLIRQCCEDQDLSPKTLVALCNALRQEEATALANGQGGQTSISTTAASTSAGGKKINKGNNKSSGAPMSGFDVRTVSTTDHLCKLPSMLVEEDTSSGSGDAKGGAGGGASPGGGRGANTRANEQDPLTRTLKVMTCAALLSHPHFTVLEALPEDVMDNLMDCVHRSLRSLQRLVSETAEEATSTTTGAKKARTVGTKASRDAAAANGSGGAITTKASCCPTALCRHLECFSMCLNHCTNLIERKDGVVSSLVAGRLEEVSYSVVQLHSYCQTQNLALAVAGLVVKGGLGLHRALCRHFPDIRKGTAEMFLRDSYRAQGNIDGNGAQSSVSWNLLPVVTVTDSVSILPLTAMAIGAAQCAIGLEGQQAVLASKTSRVDIPTAKKTVDQVHAECRSWIGQLINTFFTVDTLKGQPKDVIDHGCELIVRFGKDCTMLTTKSPYDAAVADYYLRSVLMTAVKSYLRPTDSSSSAQPQGVGSGPIIEKLRTAALDLVGQAAVELLSMKQQAPGGNGGDSSRSEEEEGVQQMQQAQDSAGASSGGGGLGELSPEASRFWLRRVVKQKEPTKGKGGGKKGKAAAAAAAESGGGSHRELSLVERMQCHVYTGLSCLARQGGRGQYNSTIPAGASCNSSVFSASDARQYLLALWSSEAVAAAAGDTGGRSDDDGTGNSGTCLVNFNYENASSSDPMDGLALPDSVGSPSFYAGLQLNLEGVSALRSKSMLHVDTAELLLSFIMGIFRSSDEGSGWDAARKRGLGLLQQLMELQPLLVYSCWGIVQQCAREDSARVREGSVTLLETLFLKASALVKSTERRVYRRSSSGGIKVEEEDDEEEDAIPGSSSAASKHLDMKQLQKDLDRANALAHNSCSALLMLLSDKSTAVSAKTIQALGHCLETPGSLLVQNFEGTLCRYVISRLLQTYDDLGESPENSRHRGSICLICAKRWLPVDPGAQFVAREREQVGANNKNMSGRASGVTGGTTADRLALHAGFVAAELRMLTTRDYAAPFDIQIQTHPLSKVLRAIFGPGSSDSTSGSGGATTTIGKGGKAAASRATGGTSRLLHNVGVGESSNTVMEKVIKSLLFTLRNYAAHHAGGTVKEELISPTQLTPMPGGDDKENATSPTSEEATMAMAACSAAVTLELLTFVEAKWLRPLVDSFTGFLALPDVPTPAAAQAAAAAASSAAAGGSADPVIPPQEVHAVVLLHSLHTTRYLLNSTSSLPMDSLIANINAVMARYLGPHNTPVITAACGALCATIDAGRKPNSNQSAAAGGGGAGSRGGFASGQVGGAVAPHEGNLKQVYISMNAYYQRARGALNQVAKDPQRLIHAFRSVFLLAEFLRHYHWEPIATHASLTSIPTGQLPNHLALGNGVVENFHALLNTLLAASTEAQKPRALSIAVRGVASLSMQHPTKYLRKCETIIRGALGSSDLTAQVEGLSAIKDFLQDEERRVAEAGVGATTDGPSPFGAGDKKAATVSKTEKEEKPAKGKKGGAAKKQEKGEEEEEAQGEDEKREEFGIPRAQSGSLTAAISAVQQDIDHNSGMSTWLIQRFGGDVMALAYNSHTQIRLLVLEVISLAVYQGLLTPVMYVETLVVSAAAPDEQASLVQNSESKQIASKAIKALAYIHDRHEDALPPSRVVNGVGSSFRMWANVQNQSMMTNHHHHNSSSTGGTDAAVLLDVREATSTSPTASLFGEIYKTLYAKHKKNREAFLLSTLRSITTESKMGEWITKSSSSPSSSATSAAGSGAASNINSSSSSSNTIAPWVVENAATYMTYLVRSLAFLPYVKESDVLLLLEQVSAGVDLHGESVVDFVDAEISKIVSPSRAVSPTSGGGNKKKAAPAGKPSIKKPMAAPSGGGGTLSKSAESAEQQQQWPLTEEEAMQRMRGWLKALGIVCVLLMKTFLRKEYGLTAAKLRRRAEAKGLGAGAAGANAASNATLPPREPGSGATSHFLKRTEELRTLWADLVVGGSTPGTTATMGTYNQTPLARGALNNFHAILTDLIEDDSTEALAISGLGAGRGMSPQPSVQRSKKAGAAAKKPSTAGGGGKKKGTGVRGVKNITRTKRNRGGQSSSDDDDDSSSGSDSDDGSGSSDLSDDDSSEEESD